MMVGSPSMNGRIFSLLKTRIGKKRTIIVGLKSDNYSREMLLRLLNLVVMPGDSVLAVHVQESNDSFDPNTFHIHEDLCKYKQVDFQVKVCIGSSYIVELSHQVRIHFATVLAVGCSSPRPKDSTITKCLKALPPSCSLLVMDNGGKILMQRQGTSQQGSVIKILQSSVSSVSEFSRDPSESRCYLQKSLTMPCSSTSTSPQQNGMKKMLSIRKHLSFPDVTQKKFERLATLEVKGNSRRFTLEELRCATDSFTPEMLIGEGGHSKVYRANLDDGRAAAVKVLDTSQHSEEDLLREVEILSGLHHENVVQLLGYCYCDDMQAVVYNLLEGSLRQKLTRLRWGERIQVAIGVARALDYLHCSSPPIIHRDVKSSNILLCENCQPQLSDFGAATVLHQNQQASSVYTKPIHVVGTFGYLAPEYMMYGKVDEKIDVFSYGVVLLELITGKEAIHRKSMSNQESLVLWVTQLTLFNPVDRKIYFTNNAEIQLQARSLLSSGLCERLIDPNLNNDYNKDEMKMMMIAARLCLLHSSSRRPTVKMILRLFEEPEHWVEMQREKAELLNGKTSSKGVEFCSRNEESDFSETLLMDG